MPEPDLTREQRRRILVAEYEQHGHLGRAMAAAGITHRKTGRTWIRRHEQEGSAGLRSRPAGRPPGRPRGDEVRDRVQWLNAEHPDWGRRLITRAINQELGPAVAAEGFVGAVLRELRTRHDREVGARRGDSALGWERDPERILRELQVGIALGLSNDFRACISRLAPIWWWFAPNVPDMPTIPRVPLLSWVMRGGVQLAHAYIHVGQWHLAREVLTFFRANRKTLLLASAEDFPRAASTVWVLYAGGQAWAEQPSPLNGTRAVASINLRPEAALAEALQYLALLYRGSREGHGLILLRDALEQLGWEPWPEDAARWRNYRGAFSHGLANQYLRRSPTNIELVDRYLSDAERFLYPDDPDMRIMNAVAQAHAEAAKVGGPETVSARDRVVAVDAVHRHLERAVVLDRPGVSAVTRIKYVVHGTGILLGLADGSEVEWDAVRSVARLCIDQRLNHQAARLVRLPAFFDHVDEATADRLTGMAREVS